jgi:glycosyltransferase involved in cell wall biosynthesis
MASNNFKNVLIVIPFKSVYPPTSGGMQRCFNILHQLSIHSNLTVITSTDESIINAAKRVYPNLNNAKFNFVNDDSIDLPLIWSFIPKKISYAVYSRFLIRSICTSANSIFLKFYALTIGVIKKDHFDYIVYEGVDSLHLAKAVNVQFPKINQVYDAYNFDTEIAEDDFSKGLITKNDFITVKSTESCLYKYIDVLWTCSRRDADLFNIANRGLIGRIDVIPNGTETKVILPNKSVKYRQELLFVGSLNYAPNEEGLIWFLKNVLPRISGDSVLNIIGSGQCSSLLMDLINSNSKVSFRGFVDCLDDYYFSADVVIVPILSGSGTRLKVLEAMKFEKAVVSTVKGAEGICITDEIIIEDDPIKMASLISSLLDNEFQRIQLGKKAKALINDFYDWNIIGNVINKSINS